MPDPGNAARLRPTHRAARRESISFLQIKTLSPTHPDRHHVKTRDFYFAMGFRPLEEFRELWGESNPCLQMVKYLPAQPTYPHDVGTE